MVVMGFRSPSRAQCFVDRDQIGGDGLVRLPKASSMRKDFAELQHIERSINPLSYSFCAMRTASDFADQRRQDSRRAWSSNMP